MAGGSFNLIPLVVQTIANSVDDLIVTTCKAIAQNAIGLAPEDTGFLKSSIYTETKEGSTYGQGMMEPPEDSYALPDIGAPEPHTGYVAVAANYGIYLEFGTRRMGAQPYLIPALEMERSNFEGGRSLATSLADAGL